MNIAAADDSPDGRSASSQMRRPSSQSPETQDGAPIDSFYTNRSALVLWQLGYSQSVTLFSAVHVQLCAGVPM